ncbi:MFS transporter [Bradyrhizobium sp. 21]|uniref:MFS transporter n=1 Tax=Bradyrhizobium sp. 21 TaxID=2782666 RepID=UPI001FF74791|nr:MFS transporter [Bradyrhizobium sp. 21]MCK1387656.1 MFS transporter [Bradyrhizobium sp. 21]
MKLTVARFVGADLPARIWILAFAALLKYLAMFVVPFAGLYLRDELGASIGEIGWIVAANAAGTLISFPAAGYAIDRFGNLAVIVVACGLEAICFVLLGQTSTIAQFGLVFFVCGALTAVFRPAFQGCLTSATEPADRPRAYALGNLVWNLSSGMALLAGGVVYANASKYIFLADAILNVAALCIFAGLATRVGLKDGAPAGPKSAHGSSPLGNPIFLAICLALFLVEIVRSQSISTFPLFTTSIYGISPAQFGLVLALGCLTLAIFILPVTTSLMGFDKRILVALGAVLMCSAYSLSMFGSGVVWSAVVVIVSSAGQMVVHPAALTLAVAASPQARRGTYLTTYYSSAALAWSVGPAAGTTIYSALGPNYLWALCSIPGLLVAGIMMGVVPPISKLERSHDGGTGD